MTAAGAAPQLRVGPPAGRLPGPPPPSGLSVAVAVASAAEPPLAARLAALVTRLHVPGTAWVGVATGDRDALDYLAELGPPAAERRGDRLVAALDPADPYVEVLLGGERAVGHGLALLQVAGDRVGALTAALAGGADPLDQALVASARLVVRHRPGQGWALIGWPQGAPSPLEEAGIEVSREPVGLPHPAGGARRAGRLLPLVLAGVLGAAALAVTLHRGTGTPTPLTVVRPSPTPLGAPAAPTFIADISGDAPAPRQRAGTVYDPASGSTLLFGGIAQGPGAGDLGDTWVWTAGHWQRLTPAHSPPGRSGAAMAYDPGRTGVLLFGGQAHGTAGTRMEDTWLWDGTDWSPVPARAAPPPGAAAVGLAWVPAQATMLLVTSATIPGAPPSTWTWDGSGWVAVAGAQTPPIRLLATEPHTGGVLGVVAGDVPGPASTWRWTGATWSLATTVGLEFEPFTATMVTDPYRGEVVVVEQLFADAAGPSGGTWTWGGQAWIHHGGDVPDVLRTFDATQALWAAAAGGLDLIGGPLDGPSYRTGWQWDGSAWRRL